MKTTKQLLKDLENRSAFWLTWAIIWRWFVIVLGLYVVAGLLVGFLTLI